MPDLTITLGEGTLAWLTAMAEMVEEQTGSPTSVADMAVSYIEWQFQVATMPAEIGDVWNDISGLQEGEDE